MQLLTPTPEVLHFLHLIQSGQSASTAAVKAGINVHESILIRKLAGLPVSTHRPDAPEKVISLRSKGHTHKQIASQLSISPRTVNNIICRHRKQDS